jgi:2-oxoglutarate dehydrogenase E2 component (dihydrolipoamide succinyltransferase)
MARFELALPAMGEGIIEATITKWLVSEGQDVATDQPLVEVATDKVDSEIPSPVTGRFVRRVFHEGEIPKVGEIIALIETGESGASSSGKRIALEPAPDPHHAIQIHESRRKKPKQDEPSGLALTPLVRQLAKQRGITAGELNQIRATGPNGMITKDDINNYMVNDRSEPLDTPSAKGRDTVPRQGPDLQEPIAGAEDKVIEMDRLRKLIAGNMVRSKQTAPHVTSFLEADITGLVNWREVNKASFFDRVQVKLTFTPIFIEAVAQALKEFPRINVSLSGDSIIIRKNINIGFATALPGGNLIVPVIRNADHENLAGLARKVSDMAERARQGSLLPAEIKGGTFTITNIGQYNSLTGTPIINQPEAAILAVGTIVKKPWAVKTENAYGIAVRDIVMLSLTYDHRVIDGALGGSFLSQVVRNLENFIDRINISTY